MPSPVISYDPEIVFKMLARHNGATSAEVAEAVGKPKQLVSNRLSKWKMEGKAWHAGGTSGDRPYFATEAARDAWVAANPLIEANSAIVEALRAAGASGMTSVQIAAASGFDSKAVAGAATRMVARGEIQARPYKGWRLYWIGGVQITQAAELALRRTVDEVTASRSRIGGKARAKAATPIRRERQATVIVRTKDAGKPEGDAIVPQGIKPLRGPSFTHDTRYQCAPGEIPFGAGFAAVGIWRSPLTGKAWA